MGRGHAERAGLGRYGRQLDSLEEHSTDFISADRTLMDDDLAALSLVDYRMAFPQMHMLVAMESQWDALF